MTSKHDPLQVQIQLQSNASATGAGVYDWPGGLGHFQVKGTFGGGTVALETLHPDGTTWLPLGDDASLDAAGAFNFELPACKIRAALAGTVSAVHAWVTSIPPRRG